MAPSTRGALKVKRNGPYPKFPRRAELPIVTFEDRFLQQALQCATRLCHHIGGENVTIKDDLVISSILVYLKRYESLKHDASEKAMRWANRPAPERYMDVVDAFSFISGLQLPIDGDPTSAKCRVNGVRVRFKKGCISGDYLCTQHADPTHRSGYFTDGRLRTVGALLRIVLVILERPCVGVTFATSSPVNFVSPDVESVIEEARNACACSKPLVEDGRGSNVMAQKVISTSIEPFVKEDRKEPPQTMPTVDSSPMYTTLASGPTGSSKSSDAGAAAPQRSDPCPMFQHGEDRW